MDNKKYKKELYEEELQQLKSHDEIQYSNIGKFGYQFITTAGHGYLVVPVEDCNASIAKKICKYGFIGKHAIYLEEDCEYNDFMAAIS